MASPRKSGNHTGAFVNSSNARPDDHTSYRKKEKEGLNLTEVKKSFLRLLKWGAKMKNVLILTTVLGLLMNGCATYTLPENFVTKTSSDFNIDIKLYSKSLYNPLECGFDRLKAQGWLPPGAPGSYEKTYEPIVGVLVLADSKILFVVARQEKYEKVLEIKYDKIVDVLVPAWGAARRLVIKCKDNCYTFSTITGGKIGAAWKVDRGKMYEFFRFISDKAHIPIPEKFREDAK